MLLALPPVSDRQGRYSAQNCRGARSCVPFRYAHSPSLLPWPCVLVGNRLSVTLNAQKIHDNVEVTGITGGAVDNDEAAPGRFMLQGDHAGDISFRKFTVTPITKPGN